MTGLFVFALTLLAAVLVSDLADRSVLSTAVLFLLAGVVAGEGLLGAIGPEHFNLAEVLTEVALGVGIGILVPWSAIRLEQSRFFSAHATYRPLNAFAIGLLVLTISSMAHANELPRRVRGRDHGGDRRPEVREAFHRFGELVAELLKLAALFVFGVFDLAPVPGRDPRELIQAEVVTPVRSVPRS